MAEGDPGRFFDDLNFDPADVPADPFVENRAEERPPRFGPDGGGAETVGLPRLWLDQGEEADFAGSDRFEKSIDFGGRADVFGVDDAKNFRAEAESFQEFVSAQGRGERGPIVRGPSKAVVSGLGPVQTEPDRESLGRQKAAPFLVEKEAVGLKAVGKSPVRGAILALKADDPAEIF